MSEINQHQPRPRTRILNEISAIVIGEDLRILSQAIRNHFHDRKFKKGGLIDQLTNSELETIIPVIKEAYGRHLASISKRES